MVWRNLATTGSLEQESNNSFPSTCRRGINRQRGTHNPDEAGEAGVKLQEPKLLQARQK